jgi:hypothetical protein
MTRTDPADALRRAERHAKDKAAPAPAARPAAPAPDGDEAVRLRAALAQIAYWHRASDEGVSVNGCRTCRAIALAGIDSDGPKPADPFSIPLNGRLPS